MIFWGWVMKLRDIDRFCLSFCNNIKYKKAIISVLIWVANNQYIKCITSNHFNLYMKTWMRPHMKEKMRKMSDGDIQVFVSQKFPTFWELIFRPRLQMWVWSLYLCRRWEIASAGVVNEPIQRSCQEGAEKFPEEIHQSFQEAPNRFTPIAQN